MRISQLGAVAGVFVALTAAPVAAKPVVVEFLPPAIELKPVCVQRSSDKDVVDRWIAWDRKALRKEQPWLVLREAQRLRDIDPQQYFPIIKRMIELLPTIDPGMKTEDIAAEEITLYLRAGKTNELRQSSMVDELISRGEANSPKSLFLAAELMLSGVSAKHDERRALAYLVAAAYGGNPNALLELAKRNLEGQEIEGWSVDPSLAVTMAFGAMVGKLDNGICDRVTRIAREYEKGEVVAQDRRISEAWLRFAADLGDGNAAWNVARYHLASSDITKDNDQLLHYLQFAADKGVVAAQSELGHLYEVGAIVPRDLGKSEYYYRLAVAAGHRNSLIKLANLYEGSDQDGEREKYRRALNELAAIPDPPGWVFAKLANLTINEKGYWRAEKIVTGLFEEGAQRHDMTSIRNLALIRLQHSATDGQFDEGINLLLELLDSFGRTDTMADLRDAYLCHAPDGPQVEKARYWSAAAKEALNAGWSVKTIEDLVEHPRTAETASLQSGALNGQSNFIAGYLWYLKTSKAPPEAIGEWEKRVEQNPDAKTAYALLMLQAADGMDNKRAALNKLLAAAQDGGRGAKTGAADLILTSLSDDTKLVETARDLLHSEAASGSGAAMQLLATKSGPSISAADIYRDYTSAIEDRGDTEAMIFAAQRVADIERKRSYLTRAAGRMDCSFDTALSMARAYFSFDQEMDAVKWMQAAEAFSTGKPWRARILAETFQRIPKPDMQTNAMRLFEVAALGGDARAEQSLLKAYLDTAGAYYSPKNATDLMVTTISKASPAQVLASLSRLERSHKAIHEQVLARVNLATLFHDAALAGDPIGMREFGKLQLAKMDDPGDALIAQDMFLKAADKGDVEAMVLLSRNYAFGIGTDPSLSLAKTWLEKAASLGNKEAKEMLVVMTMRAN
ncbi:hypothetical protein ASC90_10230 [Rhizobium sp. Root1220]|nr:hypothetical protein ASC90_10230 [Rhizobium sp. Root1220]